MTFKTFSNLIAHDFHARQLAWGWIIQRKAPPQVTSPVTIIDRGRLAELEKMTASEADAVDVMLAEIYGTA